MMSKKRELPHYELQVLESRYRATLRKLREEMKRPLPNSILLQRLKRKRVHLKDQIATLLRSFSRETFATR